MNPYFYVLSVNGLLFFVSVLFYFFTPKKINALYGYKTNKTIKNTVIWQYANSFFSKQLIIYAAISLVFALFIAFLNPIMSWQPMAIMLLAIAVSVIKTEQELFNNFDEEGELKK